MKESIAKKPSLKDVGVARRKAVSLSQEGLVKIDAEGERLPLLIEPTVEGLDLAVWAGGQNQYLQTLLPRHGAILFRGFTLNGPFDLERLITSMAGEPVEYSYSSTPRTRVSGNIYTSTEYPADQSIPLHNELAYSLSWPMKIWFYCIKPAESGGETPIADSRRVFESIDIKVRERFASKKVMYIRNYGNDLDLAWQDVFQTTEKSKVEEYCRKAAIEFEWLGISRLRTRQVCQAVARHPKTGEMVWFNQAHLFHVSSLEPTTRANLLASFSEEDLPRNAYYGDGSSIEESALDEIRAAYDRVEIVRSWRAGDVLMLDNMIVCHGRRPYRGPRRVVVGMAEPFTFEGSNSE